MVLGIAVHKGLAQANLFSQGGIEDCDATMEEILSATNIEADAVTADKEMQWDDPSDMGSLDDLKMRAKHILQRAVPALSRETATPVLIEAALPEIILPSGVPLVGFTDLVDEHGEVYDFKVGARAKNQGDVDQDLQLSVYSYGFTPDFKGGSVPVHLVSVNSKNGEVKRVSSTRTKAQGEAAIEQIDLTVQQIMTGICPPTTESWACGPSYCGFWSVCKYGGKK
jgi:hypothetical protein